MEMLEKIKDIAFRIRTIRIPQGNYIYPECPQCGNKSSSSNGVPVREATGPSFEWSCHECREVHQGWFNPFTCDINWIGEYSEKEEV